MSTATQTLSLEQFLQQAETKPAAEFIHGEVYQKPMPQGELSCLQSKLCAAINQVAELSRTAYAFPELRCTFSERSIVPDIAVFRWERIPRLPSGRIENRFTCHPDWAIEILSPDQSQTTVLSNLLHCSEAGTELGWLVDPMTEQILIVLANQRVRLLRREALLPILSGLELSLTPGQIFSWLNF
jgi:Uma2 family endonuclease